MADTAFDLLKKFKQLPSSDSRHVFLTNLVPHLLPHERQLLSRRVEETSKLDVLLNLPPELVSQVVREMDPLDVVTLRRVSKNWRAMLSSPDLCRQIHRVLFPFDDRIVREADWPRVLNAHLSRRKALIDGKPWSRSVFNTGPPFSTCRVADYNANRLSVCWAHDWRVALLELRIGHQRHLFAEVNSNREPIVAVQMSQAIIVALTHRG